MMFLLVLCLLVVCAARWIWLRDRLSELEARIGILERQENRRFSPIVDPPGQPAKPPVLAEPPRPAPPPPPPAPMAPPPPFVPRPAPPPRDWEAVVGGNWLNKLGVFILVIGIALALGYSFTRVGPAGRVAISLCAGAAMLGVGVALESRYRAL